MTSDRDESQELPESPAGDNSLTQSPQLDESADSAPEVPTPSTQVEELPDIEELTPELMEDECIRGDIMLRWAVLLLALLLGWTYVTHSEIFVDIRSGEYLLAHGFLPPANDPLGIAEQPHRWINTSWLSDIIVAGAHQVGGFAGVSVLTAVLTFVSFWLLGKSSIMNMTTWWPSICAAVAMIAIFPALQAGATLWTVVLAAALAWQFSQISKASGTLWGLPLITVLWSNLGEGGGIAAGIVVAYLLFSALQKKLSWSQAGIWGTVTLAATALFHPFVGSAFTEIPKLYQATLEAQQYGGRFGDFSFLSWGIAAPQSWNEPSICLIAAVVLAGLSFVALFLNAGKCDWSLVLVWLMANGLSFVFGEWICYAAVFNCVVAGVNGQEWYRDHFSMEYKIDSMSVFFARSGRAVTVLVFFALAYLAINGALLGVAGRRIGTGLDPRWQNRLDSVAQLTGSIYKDNVFPVRPDLGDVLIWHGKRPFIDSRFELLASGGRGEQHRDLRGAMLENDEQSSWQEQFEQNGIVSSMFRLWGADPAYGPFFTVIGNSDWMLVGLDAAGAIFNRTDLEDLDVATFNAEHQQTRFVETAFRAESQDVVSLNPQWPRPKTDYDRWLIQELPVTDNAFQRARHYDTLRSGLQQFLTPQQATALATLTVREVRNGLQRDADDPLAYRALRQAYIQLDQLELTYNQFSGSARKLPMRLQLATLAAFSAARASNDAPIDLEPLFQLVVSQQRIDVALQIADKYETQTGRLIATNDQTPIEGIEQMQSTIDGMREMVDTVKDQVNQMREDGELMQLVSAALNGSCPLFAVELLEEDLTQVAVNPVLQVMYAKLLLDVGRTEDAWEQLESLEQKLPLKNPPPETTAIISQWRDLTSIANLAAGNDARAVQLWADSARALTRTNLMSLLQTPFAASGVPGQQDFWSTSAIRVAAAVLSAYPERHSDLLLQQALIEIEMGQLDTAESVLEEILKTHPETSVRGSVVAYLNMLNGKEYEFAPPSAWIPVWDDMFAPDQDGEESAADPKSTDNEAPKESASEKSDN